MSGSLATIFDDAYLREKERWEVEYAYLSGCYQVWLRVTPDHVRSYHSGTRFECERFIHQRARAAGFAALRDNLPAHQSRDLDAVEHFLASVAGDSDNGKGE